MKTKCSYKTVFRPCPFKIIFMNIPSAHMVSISFEVCKCKAYIAILFLTRAPAAKVIATVVVEPPFVNNVLQISLCGRVSEPPTFSSPRVVIVIANKSCQSRSNGRKNVFEGLLTSCLFCIDRDQEVSQKRVIVEGQVTGETKGWNQTSFCVFEGLHLITVQTNGNQFLFVPMVSGCFWIHGLDSITRPQNSEGFAPPIRHFFHTNSPCFQRDSREVIWVDDVSVPPIVSPEWKLKCRAFTMETVVFSIELSSSVRRIWCKSLSMFWACCPLLPVEAILKTTSRFGTRTPCASHHWTARSAVSLTLVSIRFWGSIAQAFVRAVRIFILGDQNYDLNPR